MRHTPEVEKVFKYEEKGYLWQHSSPWWEGNLVHFQTKCLSHGMEKPDLKRMGYVVKDNKHVVHTAGSSMAK